jgi:outer membrane protein insertion porin family
MGVSLRGKQKPMSTVTSRLWLAAVAAVALSTAPMTAPAQTRGAGTIADVKVEGSQRIEPATVISYMALKPGDDYSDRGVDESVKSLFATGLFANVQIRREGSSLVVTVEENPIINEIAFEGNDRFDDTKLTAEIEERPRQVYTRTKAQSDADRIQQLYRRSGRFAVAVEPKIIKLDQNRVNLVFEIREGDLAKIERINFVGNRAFSNGELRDEILTKETEWWNILASNDTYDPDRLAVDQEMLRRYYLNRGYADFRVVSAVSELAPDGEGFFITFTVDEGERYKFGKIDVNSALPGVTPEELKTVIVSDEGDWYSSKSVEDSIQALTTYLGDRQYAFVDIQPSVQRNRDEHLIAITYEISEGPRVFVERIDISGNVRTADEVIRREFELAEGDPFNASRLKKSETNIRNLGFFSKVDIKPIQGSAPDQTVVQAAVTEQSTGEVQLGVGYSTSDGPLGDVTIRERNLLGRGQDLRLSTSLSGVSSQIDLSFTEPYFLGRNLAAGFDLFRTTRDNQSFSSYDETNTGFALRMGYPLSENLRQTLRYRLNYRQISDVEDDASRFIKEQEGNTLSSAVQQTLSYDRLDSRINPTDGYRITLSNEIAGLGGDVHYFKTQISADWYYPVTDSRVLNIGGQIGNIIGLGEDVRINDRFFLGGNSFRGFRTGGLGPRDLDSDDKDALGGKNFALGSVELSFPLGLPSEFALQGHAFTDFGSLWGADESGPGIVDDAALRASAGMGVSWASPFGPIRLDYAYPFAKQDYDKQEQLHISFGTRF